ncbi:Arc family DNA-binding protein [Frankia sp. R82]|uniref:Arc family DNA-binding protein n=1 Tax=Frankia sp. R82 TaxID=2950553 RepID=UPI0020445F9E|nr:Arc family DNA-binding protein [Frankia sp. R82]MCM3882713.1 Arc family DNA-binding protein [Frankia sp. R82]
MIRTITLRLPDEVREATRRHAASDGVSMNTWLIRLIDTEISRRRSDAGASEADIRTTPPGSGHVPRPATHTE